MNIQKDIATFIVAMGKVPLLTHAEEQDLAKVIKVNKEGRVRDNAIKKFAESNLRLVLKEAFKISNKTGLELKDLIGYGCIGLMKAIYKYNPKYGTRFSTYAIPWIQQGMRDYMYKNSGPVQVPIHIINGLSKHKKLMDKDGTKKNDDEIMSELQIDSSFLKRIKKAYISSVSLDQEQTCNNTDDGRTFEETIPDENAVDPSLAAESSDKYGDLYAAMNELDSISQEIVTAQFLDSDKVQLDKLGKKYGVTGERVRQIKVKALRTLRKKIQRRIKFGK